MAEAGHGWRTLKEPYQTRMPALRAEADSAARLDSSSRPEVRHPAAEVSMPKPLDSKRGNRTHVGDDRSTMVEWLDARGWDGE